MHIDYAAPVLVVDDEPAMLSLVKQLIEKLGFEEVDQALNCESALRLLQRRAYQAVICDLNMKPMSGMQLLRVMRDDEKLRHTPFLLS